LTKTSEKNQKKSAAHACCLTQLKGVGPKVEERLGKLGLNTIQDILFHLPYRYEDRTRVIPIGSLRHGQSALIEATVDYASVAFTRKGKNRRMLLVHVTDGTGSLLLRFFYFNKQQQDALAAGTTQRFFGDVRYGASSIEMVHPEYSKVDENTSDPTEKSLTPVYHTTDGVSQFLLRRLSEQCLQLLNKEEVLPEYLTSDLLAQDKSCSLADAIRYVHRPPVDANINALFEGQHTAQLRLIFEELVAQHLSFQVLREKNRKLRAVSLQSANHLLFQFIKSLPFELTLAQQKVNQAILQDLESGLPMMRLVQGDVGSGKTVVAALACLKAVESDMQAAIMAPTEILAEQHYKNFTHWFKPLGINVVWLSGQIKGKKRTAVLAQIISGEAQVIVGTHALFQKDVEYKSLALAITDEQHRFGVQQRMALAKKASSKNAYKNKSAELAHQLIMTATPIPRSLAMTAYADLDYSVIDELPPGRKPITTVVIQQERREEILERIYRACSEGKQAYWVCTLVEESEALQCQAAQDTAQMLQNVLPDINVGLIHGRLKSDEKNSIMQDFKNAKIQLLVATTVIEVGVDVPNSSLMIIENAERLGLSQLHQLRGRVGRGSEASHCVLMFKSPLSDHAKERLTIMRKTNSGFEIARKDLQLRGPGEVLGTRQTGLMQLKIADIVRDEYMLEDVKIAAQKILDGTPEKVKPLIDRWVGVAQQYMNVG